MRIGPEIPSPIPLVEPTSLYVSKSIQQTSRFWLWNKLHFLWVGFRIRKNRIQHTEVQTIFSNFNFKCFAMDLTETLTYDPQLKTHKPNEGAADEIVSVKFEPRKQTESPCFDVGENSVANLDSIVDELNEGLSGIDLESSEALTREFSDAQLGEASVHDSCLEFESIERNPNDEACLVEEGSPGDPTQVEECESKLLDSAIRNHEAGNEPTVLFGSDTIPFVSDGLEGKLLDHYLLKDRIGSGGMARVYLANDTLLQRNVAIKVIQNREYVTDEQMANSLMVEAVAQAQLNHPNIVSVFYVGKTDRMPFLAMEHVDGQSLEQRLADGPIPVSEAVAYCFQIIEALQHAESHDVIHGDIKPANLLIDRQNHIKLSDFGLARQAGEDGSQVRRLVGTPSHMAPELFEKMPVDKQTDLYALGVTFFQMIFNRHPYELVGETAEEVKLALDAAKLRIPEMWPEEIPVSLRMILTKLLEKKRSDRYHSLEDLKRDLKREFAPAQATAGVSLRCLAISIDAVVYALIMVPFCLQIAMVENSVIDNSMSVQAIDLQHGLSRLISCGPLLILPFLYLICTAVLRRTLGQWATQTKTIRDHTLAISIPLFFRREIARTVSIWYSLIPLATAAVWFAPPIWLSAIVACGFVIAVTVNCRVGLHSPSKSSIDERFETSEIVLG